MELWFYLILFITGLISGFYSGLVGSGGNVILIPVLDYILYRSGLREDLLVKSIIAHSLMVSFFLGAFVAYRQYKAGNFFLKEVLLTSAPGAMSAIFMTWLITQGDWYNKNDFDIVFAFMLFLLMAKLIIDKKSGMTSIYEKKSSLILLGIGAITGAITSLSGLGGGITLIPGFTDIMKMSLKKASSISISVISILALPISISYLSTSPDEVVILPLQVGLISFAIVAATMVGILISAPYGVKAAHRINPRIIKAIFAVVVGLLLLKMIYSLI